ncbi:MAG: hypothetical protein ACRDOM_00235 [Nocardioides sp.]
MTAVVKPIHVDPENPFAGQGWVLLDIGGDVGALVVTMPVEWVGEEVEIRPAGVADRHDHAHHPHVAVVERPVAQRRIPSLVFGELVEGRYDLCPKGTDDVRLRVEVLGGQVATAEWPT